MSKVKTIHWVNSSLHENLLPRYEQKAALLFNED